MLTILKLISIIGYAVFAYTLSDNITFGILTCLYICTLCFDIYNQAYSKGLDDGIVTEKEYSMTIEKGEIIKTYNYLIDEFRDKKAEDILRGDFCWISEENGETMGVLAKSNALQTDLGKIKVIIVF